MKDVATLTGHTDSVSCVLQLTDGRIVSGSDDNTLIVWDANRNTKHHLVGHMSWVTCVIQISDGRVVSGSGDATLKVWKLQEATASCVSEESQ